MEKNPKKRFERKHPFYWKRKHARGHSSARAWPLHFVIADIMLSPAGGLFSVVCRKGWICVDCECCPQPCPTSGRKTVCAEWQAGRSLLTFFPSTSRVSRALSFADSKWLLDWAFGKFVLPIPNFRVEAASVLLRKSVQSTYVFF